MQTLLNNFTFWFATLVMFLAVRFILAVMVILHLIPKSGFLLLYTDILTSIYWRSIHSILGNAV